jgi:hypothetical protein
MPYAQWLQRTRGCGYPAPGNHALCPFAGLTVIALKDSWAARQLFLCAPASKSLHGAAQLLFEHLQTSTNEEAAGEKR